MDVCVVPSEVEAFGLAAIEALALGKPAIVFHDGGGMAEVVEQHQPRDVVESVPQLAQRLEEHRAGVADPEIHRSYARRFDIARMADHFTDIYRDLASGCA